MILDSLILFLRIAAIMGMFALMFVPMMNVVTWNDDAWYARYMVSALATTVWVALLVFQPVTIIVCAPVWVVLMICGIRRPSLRNLLPLWRWLMAMRHRIKGNSPEYIVERVLGLCPIEDETTDFNGMRDYTAAYVDYAKGDVAVLDFYCGISGVTDEFVEKKAYDGLSAMDAEMVKIEKVAPAHWILSFYQTEPENPLDEVRVMTVGDIDAWNGKSVVYGRTETGAPAKLSYAQTSGIVIGGVPGSGKSAGAMLLTFPLLASPKASVAIFDGKGGVDWSWAERAASLYNNNCDLDWETTTDQLESLAQRCAEDLKSHPWSDTDPDFWHSGASALHPFHLVVIDECQTLFDVTGRSKEEKPLVERCKRAVATIVRKGRSAGWCVMLLTQKPTADSIPTNIRDNCVVRFALRVTTSEAAEAVLGNDSRQ